jgi:hypothetical protein
MSSRSLGFGTHRFSRSGCCEKETLVTAIHDTARRLAGASADTVPVPVLEESRALVGT